MEELPVNTETVNKTLDIVSESTKESRKELDKTAATGIEKLRELFWASPIGIKADVYIRERPYKLQKALEEMKAKYENIPEEHRTDLTSYIALKGANELNYSLDEEHLKEMFENILISGMDDRKNDRVKPAYIEMVKQLSREDALFLKDLKKDNLIKDLPIVRLKLTNTKTNGFVYLSDYMICIEGNAYPIPPMTADNLLRLKLIDISFTEYMANEEAYKDVLKMHLAMNHFLKYFSKKESHIDYQKGKLSFTTLGKNFIDICLS